MRHDDLGEQTHWLRYWIVIGTFHMFKGILHFVFEWFPYLYHLEVLFLMWCFLPQFKGATTVYEQCARPLFLKNEEKLDAYMNRVRTHYDDAHRSLSQAGSQLVATVVSGITTMVSFLRMPLSRI